MKKLIFGLLASVAFCFSAQAQNEYFKSGMVMIVNQSKASFVKGTTYKDWLLQFTQNSTIPTPQEDRFLKDVYQFVSTNTSSLNVYKTYDGVSARQLLPLFEKRQLAVFQNANRCGWFCQIMWYLFGPREIDELMIWITP